jgi:hypothetical protein
LTIRGPLYVLIIAYRGRFQKVEGRFRIGPGIDQSSCRITAYAKGKNSGDGRFGEGLGKVLDMLEDYNFS